MKTEFDLGELIANLRQTIVLEDRDLPGSGAAVWLLQCKLK